MRAGQDDRPVAQNGEVKIAILQRQQEYLEANHNKLEARLKTVEDDLKEERETRLKYTWMTIGLTTAATGAGWLLGKANEWWNMIGGKPH
jgi:hypothetical protein